MDKIKLSSLLLAAVLLVTSIIVHLISYEKYNKTEEGISAIEGIPRQFGDWQGTDLALEENIYELLETKSIIHREYMDNSGSERILLSIVHHPKIKVNFHSPEQCLGAKGIPLKVMRDEIEFQNGIEKVVLKLNKIEQKLYGNNSLYYYFYMSGDFVGPSYINLRLSISLNKLKNKRKSGTMIRVSIPLEEGSGAQATKKLDRFIRDIYPFLRKRF